MAGWVDYLRRLLGWHSAVAVSLPIGPYLVEAGQVAIAGCVAGSVGIAGSIAGQVQITGAEEGQIHA